MAPAKPIKTYGRACRSVNAKDAFDILLAKNLTQRKLNKAKKRKRGIEIKELPTRFKNYLNSDSLEVSTDNTFDKLLKGKDSNKIIFTNNVSKINASPNDVRKFKYVFHKKNVNCNSPRLTRSRSKLCFMTNLSNKDSTISQSKEPTKEEDKIVESLEIEKIHKKINSSLSYLRLPQVKENDSSDAVFTNSVREKIMVHSSTPLVPLKSKTIIANPISPITSNLTNLINQSLEEIKKWDDTFPNINSEHLNSKRNSLDNMEDFEGFTEFEKSNPTDVLDKRNIFVTLRSKPKHSETKHESDLNICPSYKSYSLKDFEKFEERCKNITSFTSKSPSIIENTVEEEQPSKIDFASYVRKKKRKQFVTHRKIRTNEKWRKSLTNACEKTIYKKFALKDCVVLLEKIVNPKKRTTLESRLSTPNKQTMEIKQPIINLSRLSGNNVTERTDIQSKELISNTNLVQNQVVLEDMNNFVLKELSVKLTRLPIDCFISTLTCDEIQAVILKSDEQILDTIGNNKYDKSELYESNKEIVNDLQTHSLPENHIIETESVHNNYIVDIRAKKHSLPKSDFKEVLINLEKDPQIDTKDAHLTEDTQAKTDKKKSVQNLSDIIENSVECSESSFRETLPFCGRKLEKNFVFKAGKSWRRSWLTYRRTSFTDNSSTQESCFRNNVNPRLSMIDCGMSQSSKNISSLQNRRQSIRYVPIPKCNSIKQSNTILENFAKTIAAGEVSLTVSPSRLNEVNELHIENIVQIVTAKEIVLKRCGQTEPLPFEECYSESLLTSCRKIGEGVYGEVFLYKYDGRTSVMKVIPIEGEQIINGERQKKFEEILSEIVISMELSNLRNVAINQTSAFTEVQRVCCVKGRYPKKLLELWDLYNEIKTSENESPDIFEENQLYIVLDLANGGQDLESFVFSNASQAYAMFKQVAYALAVAEEGLKFEHRDLHWGNVLLTSVEKNKKVGFKLNEKYIDILTKGVKVTIIDFTLSRIEHDGVVIFNDLAEDPDLFIAKGDYQFDIYRLMQKRNGNEWQTFEPFTNVLWLDYILDKTINGLRYKNNQSKVHKENINLLKDLRSEILTYNSVKDFVNNCF